MNTSTLTRPRHTTAATHLFSISQRRLLKCGIFASVLYIAMNVFIPMLDAGYSSMAQTVSELSAIGAPTRPVWVMLGVAYSLLVIAFGYGVWLTASPRTTLRTAGGLILANGLFSVYWPPMHMRGAAMSLTDSLHIAFAVVTVVLMLLSIGFAARAMGKLFRLYSAMSMAVLILFGALSGLSGPRIAANLPTPWIGLWERISIAAYILWVIVFAAALLKSDKVLVPKVRGSA